MKRMFQVKNVKASTLGAYVNLPLEQREVRVWWWPFKWYRNPYAMELGSFFTDNKESEWAKFELYAKEHYPVQAWLREDVMSWIYSIQFRFNDIKHSIKHHIRNPRREMRRAVFPPEWRDLVTTVVEFNRQCIIEFVEREKCFDTIDYTTVEHDKQFALELKDLYAYATTIRDRLQKELEESYNRVPRGVEYAVAYKEVNEKEAWIEECDTVMCNWVTKNRQQLWT